MIQKTPFYIPHLNFRLFIFNYNYIYDYSLSKNFNLIICLNFLYKKIVHKGANDLRQFCLKSYSMHWFRIAFKGKGFRLRRFKHIPKLTLNFGHSHWTRLGLASQLFWIRKLRRQNYLTLCTSFKTFKDIRNTLRHIKPLNVYTKRGLRLKRQFIKRRFGKISQVVSSLH